MYFKNSNLSLVAFKLSVLLTVAGPFTFAGTGSTGGGKSIVCYNEDKSIQEPIQLLDLYEGTIDHDYYYPATEVKDTKAIVMDKIKEIETKDLINFYLHSKSNESEWSYGSKGLDIEFLKYEVDKFFMGLATVDNESIRYGQIKFLKNQILKKTKDSYDIFYPKNCKVEQVAIYKDNKDKLYINYDLFKLMDNKNQAALILHEALYKLLRKNSNEKNSIRTRRFIAALFANEKIISLQQKLKGHRYIECESEDVHRRFEDSRNNNLKISRVYLMEEKFEGLNKFIVSLIPHVLNGTFILNHANSMGSVGGCPDEEFKKSGCNLDTIYSCA